MRRSHLAAIAVPILLGLSGCADNGGVAPQWLTLAKMSGDQQIAGPGAAVPVPPSVRVLDSQGHGVPGVQVTFDVATGGGAVTDAKQLTDASGTAIVGSWVLGGAAGENTLIATARGQNITPNPVTFTATAGSAAAAVGGPVN